MKLGWNILTSRDSITKEEVEKCTDRDLLENMLAEMAGEFPALSQVFVAERDLFLAHSLQMAADAIPVHALGPDGQKLEEFNPPTVVGVVGIGHMPGIIQHWGKVTKLYHHHHHHHLSTKHQAQTCNNIICTSLL